MGLHPGPSAARFRVHAGGNVPDPGLENHPPTRMGLTDAIEVPALVAQIHADTNRIASALERSGAVARVAHCGEWCVGDVVRHLGVIHRWAAKVVRTRLPAERGASAPDQDVALADWLREGAEGLCSALTEVPPGTKCWTFGGPPGKAGFWARRQALETAVHRFDVEHAVGLDARITTELAVDGISEVVDFMFPRQIELGRANPLPGRVVLTATDAPAEWVFGDPGPEAQVSGVASALLLMLWKRPHSSLTREGHESTLAALDATAVTP